MNEKNVLYGVIGLILGVILTGLFSRTAVNSQNFGMMRMMGMQSPIGQEGGIDRHFIDQMIPHHEDAITMAELALEKAEHQEIKDLAQRIITAQNREINQMKEWKTSWFSRILIPKAAAHGMTHGLNMGMMGDLSDIENLENARPFDRKFIEEMIPHHQMAVMMSQMLWNTTQNDEMKQLAKGIIAAQNEEIDLMRNWYSQWYK